MPRGTVQSGWSMPEDGHKLDRGPRECGPRGSSSAGAGASGTSRRPRSLAMWPSPRSAAASCAAAHSPVARLSAACLARPASPCCSKILNLQRADTL